MESWADAYEASALLAGHQVRRQNIGELRFDQVPWKGYSVVQPLEKNVQQTQENILWCNKWLIFYPVWPGSVRAIFKAVRPDIASRFSFKYHQKGPFRDNIWVIGHPI